MVTGKMFDTDEVWLSMPLMNYLDLSKYRKDVSGDISEIDLMNIRRDLFLEMYNDFPETCVVADGQHAIDGNYFLETNLSNLSLKRLGFCNSPVKLFDLDKTLIEESFFIHGNCKFVGKSRFNKVFFIGNFNFGEEARVIDNSCLYNASVNHSNIACIKNSSLHNVHFYNCDIKQIINCDLNHVRFSNRELYARAKNCINVPQVYKINHNIEVIAFGDKRYSVELDGKSYGQFDLNSDKSIQRQAGEYISRYYESKKDFFEVINFDIIKREYDDSYIIHDEKGEE